LRVTSRGLGDVYKRQLSDSAKIVQNGGGETSEEIPQGGLLEAS
jgi:hypothetical protein